MDGVPTPKRREPAGAARPRPAVTSAIHDATLEELRSSGYGGTTVEAVARRAGVGKAAIYRRYASKLDLVVAAFSAVAVRPQDVPDTGTLRGDVLALLRAGRRLLEDPVGSQVLPDLLAEAMRTPELDELLTETVGTPRRALAAAVVDRAVARGELDPRVDRELALDVLPSPLYWRVVVRRGAASDADLERLADAVTAALRALA